MKVLILHQHFRTPYQGGAIRSYYLGQALVQHGISVAIITGYSGKDYKSQNIDGMEVHYLPVPYDNSFGFYRRGYAFLKYIRKAVSLAKTMEGIDICYAMSVPLTVGIAAKQIAAHFTIPYIFEVGDLWPDAPIEMGFVKNDGFKKLLYNLEKRIYNSAESLVALSPAIRERLLRKATKKTVHIVPNMSDTEFFQLEEKKSSLEEKYNVQNKFVVSYLGAIGVANGLQHFVKCAKSCLDSRLPIHFILCGEGGELNNIAELSANLKLSNFTIVPLQNREGVREILNVTDACFISYKPVSILETGSPNKYFDGLASGKLIVVNFGGWIREEIEGSKCGIFIDPMSPERFAEKIEPFLRSPSLLKEYQMSSRKLADNFYSRKILGDNFARIFLKDNRRSSN